MMASPNNLRNLLVASTLMIKKTPTILDSRGVGRPVQKSCGRYCQCQTGGIDLHKLLRCSEVTLSSSKIPVWLSHCDDFFEVLRYSKRDRLTY